MNRPRQRNTVENFHWGHLAAWLLILLIIVVGIWPLFHVHRGTAGVSPETGEGPAGQPAAVSEQPVFGQPNLTPHTLATSPPHGTVLDSAPGEVDISFDMDLTQPEAVNINGADRNYATGDTVIVGTSTMRQAMDPSAPDGTYTVAYHACWTDGGCADGTFQFAVKH